MKKNPQTIRYINNINNLQSLSFIKATAWVILGISNMFSSYDLISVQRDEAWLSTVMRFGLALAFLLAGLFLQKNHSKNFYLLIVVIMVDIIVCLIKPIGLYDLLMLAFDMVFIWLIFNFLKKNKL